MAEQEAPLQPGGIPESRARLHYLDTRRVLAVATVCLSRLPPLQRSRLVDHERRDEPAGIAFEALVGPWGKLFFFLLSGAGTWFVLRRRTPRQYAVERVTRLLVPYVELVRRIAPLHALWDEGNTGSLVGWPCRSGQCRRV